ncbi:hypothetical protein SMICM304S_00859 [Streptomyces microflavus]
MGADRALIHEALTRHAAEVAVVDLDRTDTGAMSEAVEHAAGLASSGRGTPPGSPLDAGQQAGRRSRTRSRARAERRPWTGPGSARGRAPGHEPNRPRKGSGGRRAHGTTPWWPAGAARSGPGTQSGGGVGAAERLPRRTRAWDAALHPGTVRGRDGLGYAAADTVLAARAR